MIKRNVRNMLLIIVIIIIITIIIKKNCQLSAIRNQLIIY